MPKRVRFTRLKATVISTSTGPKGTLPSTEHSRVVLFTSTVGLEAVGLQGMGAKRVKELAEGMMVIRLLSPVYPKLRPEMRRRVLTPELVALLLKQGEVGEVGKSLETHLEVPQASHRQ